MSIWITSSVAFLLLGGYLALMALRFGIPDMVSDTYYQLTSSSSSSSDATLRKAVRGLPFTLVLLITAFLMLPVMLSIGGIQPLAFVGCAGLAFVGVAPNYHDRDEGQVHKAAATIAAIGCTAWCLSVSPWPTVIIATLYALYLVLSSLLKALDSIWYISRGITFHPWYWAEIAAFVDVFVTVWRG